MRNWKHQSIAAGFFAAPIRRARCWMLVVVLFVYTENTMAFKTLDRVQCIQNNVNVRTTPDTTTQLNIIGQVNAGDHGTIEDSTEYFGSSYTWYLVKWDKFSRAGYTVSDYIALLAGPTPSISSVSPDPMIGSNRAQVLTVIGSGFVSGAQVLLVWPTVGIIPGGSATLAASFVSSSELQVDAVLGADSETWTAQVINPGNVASATFTFADQAPVPVIDSLSPSNNSAGGGSFTLSVNGSTFNQSSVVSWNGFKLTTTPNVTDGLVSSLTAQVPASYINKAGTATITVYSPLPGGGTSPGVSFVIAQAGAGSVRYGVDYSVSHPTPSGLKSAGYGFAIRYASGSGSPKDITASEAQALQNAGIDIIVVFESTANRMQDGYNAGIADANQAVTVAIAAGAPSNFFCYFACDFDAQPSDEPAIESYLDAAASVLGGVKRVGLYGGYGPITRVLDAGKAAKGWQTAAWSNGNKDSRISLYQYAGEVTIAGGACDVDEGYGTDLGQWSSPPTPTITLSSPVRVGGKFTLTIQAQVGFTYTLESVDDLSTVNWAAVQSAAGAGGPIDLTDSNAIAGARFYRVKAQPTAGP